MTFTFQGIDTFAAMFLTWDLSPDTYATLFVKCRRLFQDYGMAMWLPIC
ncbi:MAG: hypothetical protein PHE86_04580 [Candidatus Marinimicrobia bacterium]|nr:hypothetical protein [Candidatus Neomarinimicrobiota bacterium]